MDKNDVKSFVIGAISGALGAFIAVNAGLAPIPTSAVEAALANVQFTIPPTQQTGLNIIRFNSRYEADGNITADTAPLYQDDQTNLIFDSTLMGPEYGTRRELNQNIIMGSHFNNSFYSSDGVQISGIPPNRIAIGNFAGDNSQQQNAIAIGTDAGKTSQNASSIAIGNEAGYTNQLNSAIAIGNGAGKTNQKSFTISIGNEAGNISQNNSAIAIGNGAGKTNQRDSAIAIGKEAGNKDQGTNSIAIGKEAGKTNQVSNSICIGFNSDIQTLHENSSKNKIAMCITARNFENTDGGASNTNSFILSNTTAGITAAVFDDGGDEDETNTASLLADIYFKDTNAVGFLNVKVNRGNRKFVGFLPLLNLKEV